MRVIQSDPTGATVELTRTELLILSNCLNELCNGPDAITPWEFHARMGVERDEAVALLGDLGTAAI